MDFLTWPSSNRAIFGKGISSLRFLQDQQLAYTLVSPLHLKKSLGITRGKNDKADAKRIAQFAYLHHRRLKPMQLPSACLLKPGAGALKNLMAFRDRLTKTKTSASAVRFEANYPRFKGYFKVSRQQLHYQTV